MKAPTRFLLPGLVVLTAAIAGAVLGCAAATEHSNMAPLTRAQAKLPAQDFTRPPEKPHDPADLIFHFDQLDYYYRSPGEFTHRLTGDQYGFQALSFIISETHPGGGPGLHVHDTEEAHVLLAGTALERRSKVRRRKAGLGIAQPVGESRGAAPLNAPTESRWRASLGSPDRAGARCGSLAPPCPAGGPWSIRPDT